MFTNPLSLCITSFFLSWSLFYWALPKGHLEWGATGILLFALVLSHPWFLSSRWLLLTFFVFGAGVRYVQYHSLPHPIVPQKVICQITSVQPARGLAGRGVARVWNQEGEFMGSYQWYSRTLPESSWWWTLAKPRTPCDDPLPGGFSASDFLYSQGFSGSLFFDFMKPLKASKIKRGRRHKVKVFFKKHLPEHWGLALALTTGDKEGLSKEFKEKCRVLGISHVMAISGLHVGIVVGGIYALLFGFRRWVFFRISITLLVGLGFVWFAGSPPSAQRALWVLTFYWTCKGLSRSFSIEIALGVTLFCMALFMPHLLFSIGLHLSLAAVLGIRGMQKISRRIVQKIPTVLGRWVGTSVSISIGAQLGTLPIILLYFNSFPTYFLWNNLWAIPAFTLLLYSLVIGIFLGFTGWEWGTHVWFQLISEGQDWLNHWVTVHSLLPGAQWLYLFPSHLFCWLLGVAIAIVLYCTSRKVKWALLGIIMGGLPWIWESPSMRDQSFCIWGRPAQCRVVNSRVELTVTAKDSAWSHQKLEHLLAGRAYQSAHLIIKSKAP